MILEPLPKILQNSYRKDALVYENDITMYYNYAFDKLLLDDIKAHQFQIFGGTYRHNYSDGTTDIYLIGRGRTCGKKSFIVSNYFPFCWMRDKNGSHKTYLGEKVGKIIFHTEPRRVADLRKMYEKFDKDNVPCEADILFVRNMLMSMYDFFKPIDYVEPKICIMDLETNFPVNNKIISFAINGYDGFLYYNSIHQDNGYRLIIDLYDKLMPYDIVANWNVEFDMGILKTKVEKIGLAFKPLENGYEVSKSEYIRLLSVHYNHFGIPTATRLVDDFIEYGYMKYTDDGKIVYGDKKFDTDVLFNITSIDLIPIAKKMYGREIPGRWSLDNTGKQLCGIGKVDMGDKRYVRELDEETLFEYNVRDVIVPEIIDNYLGALQCHIILAWSLQALLNDMIITAAVNDIALIRAYRREGVVLPSRPPHSNKDDEEEPAYDAAEPDARPGVYEDVVVGDITHAYPSAVIGINASAETKDKNGKHIVQFVNKNGEYRDIRFNDGYSIFIKTLKELMDERAKVKKKMKEYPKDSPEWRKYKFIDFSIKTQTAAFSHGIFGWKNSRMVDVDVADAITATVRDLLNKIKDYVDRYVGKWIYTHTDSCYFVIEKDISKEQAIDKINNMIEEHCKSKGFTIIPELEYKGSYPKAYIHSPARNVLVDENGEWHPTGVNYMRSEVPPPLADIEKGLIAMKLNEEPEDRIFDKLRDLVVKLKDISSNDLAIIKPLTKKLNKYGKMKDGVRIGLPYHITAYMLAQKEYGMEVNIGEKYNVLPIISNEYTGVRVIRRKKKYMAFPLGEELPDMYGMDWKEYLKSNLWGKINSLLGKSKKELEDIILTDEVKELLNIDDGVKKND